MYKKKYYFVYILTNKAHKVLYTGLTNDLIIRVAEHKDRSGSKFTSRYNVSELVFYEVFEDVTLAIVREKQIKA